MKDNYQKVFKFASQNMNSNEKHNTIKNDKKYLKRNTAKSSKFMKLLLKKKNYEESNP